MADGGVTRAALAPRAREAGRAVRLPWWGTALLLSVAGRGVTAALLAWVSAVADPGARAGAHPSLLQLASAWDGTWYWLIGTSGYPGVLPLTASGAVDTNQWAFLPVYPFLAKALTFGLLDWRLAALVVSVVSGSAAAVLLGVLLVPHIGRSRALFAIALLSVSPLAFLFETDYAEPLALVLLLGLLVLVDRRRYLTAIPVAVVFAFTRPGVLAVALAVAALLVVRYVAMRRGGPHLPIGELGAGALLVAVCIAAGFAWTLIAAVATGREDAYFATESAWRALWMPDTAFSLFQPWFFAAHYWASLLWGDGVAGWAAPVFLVLLVVAFALALLTPAVRRLGLAVRLWCAAYALYLLAVFFPQSSVFRLLVPMAPLAGAVVPRSVPARAAVLVASIALQALWLWVCYGRAQDYWTVP